MSNNNVKPTRTDEYGTWEQQSARVWTLIPGTETQKWHDEHPAREPEPDEPTPDDDAITAEEALAILLGGEDE